MCRGGIRSHLEEGEEEEEEGGRSGRMVLEGMRVISGCVLRGRKGGGERWR
jgi:hypothetical protein